MVRFYVSLGILISMWHSMKAQHPQIYMDMHIAYESNGLVSIGVKNLNNS
jgi:hypothetical protein